MLFKHLLVCMLVFSLLALLVLGAACWQTSDRGQSREWLRTTYDLAGTSLYPYPSRRLDGYTLRPAWSITLRKLASLPSRFYACRISTSDHIVVLYSQRATETDRDYAAVARWTALEPGQSQHVGDGLLLAPFRSAGREELSLLTWQSDFTYVRASKPEQVTRSYLFSVNYAREGLLDDTECFKRALRKAALEESVHVSSYLRVLGSDAQVQGTVRIAPSCKPLHAVVAVLTDDEPVGLVYFNSGYQVSEDLYLEVMEPPLEAGDFAQLPASRNRYGGLRGMMAVGLERPGVLWERWTGGIPKELVVADVDGDGLQNVIVPVYSPENGVSANGTTDAGCAYLLYLDDEGHELWRHRVCGPFMGVSAGVSDVTGDEALDIVCVSGSNRDSHWGSLAVLSGDGRVLREERTRGSMIGLLLVDVVGDSKKEIVTSGPGGEVLMLDGELQVLASYTDTAHAHYEESRLRPVAANDLDGDGDIEIVAVSSGWTSYDWRPQIDHARVEHDSLSYVIVLNSSLHEEARARVPRVADAWMNLRGSPSRLNCLIADLDGDEINEIVLRHAKQGANVFELTESDGAGAQHRLESRARD